jgi:selenocysteine lyase/cysteine desulfurase
LIALIHASNVTGAIQPIAAVGQIAREAAVLFLVDAAQTAGHLPIDLRNLPVDILAAPGHKGLLGPLGTGFLYFRPGVEQRLASLRQGGTGTRSEDDVQPESLPDKYESGNHNAPGLVGLEAAVSWLLARGVNSVHDHSQGLVRQLLAGLSGIPRVRAGLHCAPGAHRAIGSFDSGGTVRFSIGPFTTADDVAAAIEALRQIAETL